MLAESAGGVALALSFALLWQRRLPGALTVLALQSAVVALAAAGQAGWPLALAELGWGAVGLPWLLSRTPAPPMRVAAAGAGIFAAAAALTAVALSLGRIGPGLAELLLGVLFVAVRPGPAMLVAGLSSLQNGVALAGLACGGGAALLTAPLLPAVVLGWFWARRLSRPSQSPLSQPPPSQSPPSQPPPSWRAKARYPRLPSARDGEGVDGGPSPAMTGATGAAATGEAATGEAMTGPAATGGLTASPPAVTGEKPPAPTLAAWLKLVDFAACLLLLLLSCALPWLGALPGPWRLDPFGILAAILVSLVAASLRWPGPGRGGPVRLGGCIIAAGALLAVLAGTLPLVWIGLAIAASGAVAAASARHRRLAGLGLGFALFGSLTLPAEPLPAAAVLLVGLACLGSLTPEFSALAALLVLRLRGLLVGVPDTAGLDPLLLAAGGLALLVAVGGLATARADRRLPAFAMLGQTGVAVFALGVDTPEATFAAVLQVTLLALTRLALELAPAAGLPRMAALAGLAGLPPFGLFPSLALLLAATASGSPGLLLPLTAGLAALAWLVLRQLPAGPYRVRPELAWLPLAALLLFGFAMPGPLDASLRLVAGALR